MGTGAAYKEKKEARCSGRVALKYVLLQVPELVGLVLLLILVQQWVDLPGWLVWTICGGWVLKDVVLFPFVWRAYDSRLPGRSHAMIGHRGVAEERLAPSGYIRVRGELWRAVVKGGGPAVEKGEAVRVFEMRGLTLVVEADPSRKPA